MNVPGLPAGRQAPDDARRKQAVKEIIALKKELGEDYLQKEKDRNKDLSKEIIIAIENQRPDKNVL